MATLEYIPKNYSTTWDDWNSTNSISSNYVVYDYQPNSFKTETMPPMVSKPSKYPFECPLITENYARKMVNTKLRFIVHTHSTDGNPELFTIVSEFTGDISKGKFGLLSLDLLEQSELITYDEEKHILCLGYIDCEIIGYIPLPYKAYLIRIIE